MKSQHIAFLSEMEEDEEEEEDGMPTQVSLISQDGTEQVWTLTPSSVWRTSYLSEILPLPSLGVLFKAFFQCKTDPGPSWALSVMRAPFLHLYPIAAVLMWRVKNGSLVPSSPSCWTGSCRCLPRLVHSAWQRSPPGQLSRGSSQFLLTQAGFGGCFFIICIWQCFSCTSLHQLLLC